MFRSSTESNFNPKLPEGFPLLAKELAGRSSTAILVLQNEEFLKRRRPELIRLIELEEYLRGGRARTHKSRQRLPMPRMRAVTFANSVDEARRIPQ